MRLKVWQRKIQGSCPALTHFAKDSMQQIKNISTAGAIASELTYQLEVLGFGKITSKEVDGAAWITGKWDKNRTTGIIKENETVFNLGLDKGRSNFFVFMKQNGETIEIFYTEPRSDEASLAFTHEDLYKHRVLSVNMPNLEKAINEVIEEISYVAGGKFEEDFRMQTHHHSKYLFDSSWEIFDDAKSNIGDVIRKAMLYHTDIWNLTPHNSSDPRVHAILDSVCISLGITYVPGTEITGTNHKTGTNGPHIVVMLGGYGAGTVEERLRRQVLKKMNKALRMESYLMGADFDYIENWLQAQRKTGTLAFGYAHPINNSSVHIGNERYIAQIASTGIVSSDMIPFDQTKELILKSDCIAAFNPSMSGNEMNSQITDVEVKLWLYGLIRKYKLGENLTANACNLAVAKWAEENGIGSFYESDEHVTTPTDQYSTGNDGFAKGFTRALLRKELFERLSTECRKLTASEFVKAVHEKAIKLHAKIFYVINDGTIELAKARTEETAYSKIERFWLKIKQGWHYFTALLHDAFYFTTHGNVRKLFAMDK
jgi:hypothetical protein